MPSQAFPTPPIGINTDGICECWLKSNVLSNDVLSHNKDNHFTIEGQNFDSNKVQNQNFKPNN